MKDMILKATISAIENGIVPDAVTRAGMRQLIKDRLSESHQLIAKNPKYFSHYVEELKSSPLAIMTKEANQQHYEVPTIFYDLSLGQYKKYSSCFWDESTQNLEEAEKKALDISIERADITDGMRILELGCGWGSLSLELARRFPRSHILSISNSRTQKEYIDNVALKEGLKNLTVETRNLALEENYHFNGQMFDRVMSIEMMEHLRNYDLFFKRLSPNIVDGGKFFIHIFTHKDTPYFFETEGEDNWMGRYFFSGGQMPARNLFDEFQGEFTITNKWDWNGIHYSKTLEEWLKKADQNKEEILKTFEKTYGEKDAKVWFQRWRMFYMACSELFKYNEGTEWAVTHYLLEKRKYVH